MLHSAVFTFVADNSQAPHLYNGDGAFFRLVARPYGLSVAGLDSSGWFHADVAEALRLDSVVLYRVEDPASNLGVKLATVVGLDHPEANHLTADRLKAARRWQAGLPTSPYQIPEVKPPLDAARLIQRRP